MKKLILRLIKFIFGITIYSPSLLEKEEAEKGLKDFLSGWKKGIEDGQAEQ